MSFIRAERGQNKDLSSLDSDRNRPEIFELIKKKEVFKPPFSHESEKFLYCAPLHLKVNLIELLRPPLSNGITSAGVYDVRLNSLPFSKSESDA